MLCRVTLAGGFGTRLRRGAVGGVRKVLVEVGGRLFLNYQLALLVAVGISEVALCPEYVGQALSHLRRR